MSTNVNAVSTIITKKLYGAQLSTSASTAPVPASSWWIIKTAVVCNTSAGAATLTLDLVESADTAGTDDRISSAFPIGAGETMPLNDVLAGVQMTAGDFLSMTASANTALTITITGIEGS